MAIRDCILISYIWVALVCLEAVSSTVPPDIQKGNESDDTPSSSVVPLPSTTLSLSKSNQVTSQHLSTTNKDETTASVTGSLGKSSTIKKVAQEITALNPASAISQRGEFSLRNESGSICLRAKFAAMFHIHYKSKTADDNQESTSLSAKASVRGHCGSNSQGAVLILQWDDVNNYTLNLTFRRIVIERRWVGQRIQLTINTKHNHHFDGVVHPGVCVVHSDDGDNFFGTMIGKSRSCISEQNITLKSDDKADMVVMEITKLHLQPFDMVNGTFGEASPCDSDKNTKNNTASVVVGFILAIFTVVVIVGYAIGRKMGYINERPGYSTME